MTRILYIVAWLLCFLFCLTVLADQATTTEDSRKVILKDDGTWEYVNEEIEVESIVPSGQTSDPSVPVGIADGYRNKYDFERALEWYNRIIQDFPESLAAGNASINRLGILSAEGAWYNMLSADFFALYHEQYNEASRYSYGGAVRGELMLKANALKRKSAGYRVLGLKVGKALREEFYRFEKSYSSMMGELSIPLIPKYSGEKPSIFIMEEEQRQKLLALGNEKHLEYESRRKYNANTSLLEFCVVYLSLGGELPVLSLERINAYYSGKLEPGIDASGLYYTLGINLINLYQYKAAFLAFRRTMQLSEDKPYSKLAYESSKRIDYIKVRKGDRIINRLRTIYPDKIAELRSYVEPYIRKDNPQPESSSTNIVSNMPKTKVGKDGAEMVLIPAGECQMVGNTVYVDAFYMDIYEVTNIQYKKFMDATGHKTPLFWYDSEYNGPNYPVVSVSWDDAVAYTKWAGKRLPTEPEWEYAARGGLVGKIYPWGNSISHDDANYSGMSGIDSKDRWIKTSPVGSFDPNGYGLYDMAGNVYELCPDWYDGDYYSSLPKSNPKGTNSGIGWVLRGGAWNSRDPGDFVMLSTEEKEIWDSLAQYNTLRCENRLEFYSTVFPSCIGFRCAMDVNP